MAKLEDILASEDISQKIELLKRGRKIALPKTKELLNDWDANRHEIMTDKEKYPKVKLLVTPEETIFDEDTGKSYEKDAVYKEEEPNRICIPLEQDIVNIHTAFTVGTEPKIDCTPENDKESSLLTALKQVLKKNKTKYLNRKIVRAWLSETEVAEYWYIVKDDSFWQKLKNKLAGVFGKVVSNKKLKCTIWSPFRGDTLYPFFDEYGQLIAFSRRFEKKGEDGKTIECFTTITEKSVYEWELIDEWKLTNFFNHSFSKLPVMYTHRKDALCSNIKSLRVRIEKQMSEYADCIDYHFFPIMKLFGDVTNIDNKDKRNRMVQLMGNGADAQYLTWNQASEPVRFELENLISLAYSQTNTPRISFENLKGSGNALSGVSFRYVFMGAHMAVENHAEDIGEFFQRRANFLTSAIGDICPILKEASQTIDVEVKLQPYMIDDIADKVNTATQAVSGHIWSKREGIIFAGNAERLEEELKEIEEETKEKSIA